MSDITRTELENMPVKQSRCGVCSHPAKFLIESMLIAAWSAPAIEAQFAETDHPVSATSIRNHAKRHLDYQERAIRNIVEQEAKLAQINEDAATESIVTNTAYLKILRQKGLEGLIDGSVSAEPRDVLRAVDLLEKLESAKEPARLAQFRLQYEAFQRAVEEVVPKELWAQIIEKLEQNLNRSDYEVASTAEEEDEALPEASSELT